MPSRVSSIKIPTSILIGTLHHFEAFLVPLQRRNFGFHSSHTSRKPMHDFVLICIDEICRGLGARYVCPCFDLGPTTLSILESQMDCRQFGLPRLELGTHLCKFSLAPLVGFGGVITRQQHFVKLGLHFTSLQSCTLLCFRRIRLGLFE